MPKVITTSRTVYTFDELSPEAQKRAIEKHAEFIGETWDSSAVIDDAKQVFAFLGITVDRVFFSGFWSQGDGACFEGRFRADKVNAPGLKEYAPQDQELHRLADVFADFAQRYPDAGFSVIHRGHYYHQYCTAFDVDGLLWEEKPEEALAAEKELIEAARDCMKWIYRQLEKDYDWHTSEEQVRKSILANEYTYTAEGKRDNA